MSNYFDDSGLIMFQCDVCGRKLNTVNYINGMKFCAKCHQETFGSKITEDMLIDMIKKTGWTLPENKDFLINIDNETTILNQQRKISELEKELKLCQKLHNELFLSYEKLKDKNEELKEQLKNSIVPKFNRQEHICSFAFGEIREYIVVAYLDNDITLCENIETSELEWCDNNFLVRTYEEAQAKLRELQGEKE